MTDEDDETKEKYTNQIEDINYGAYIIGLFAGACTTFAFLPSVIRVFRKKIKTPISEYTLILSLVGNLTWVLYSLSVKDYVLTGYTGIAAIFFILLILSKFIYKS